MLTGTESRKQKHLFSQPFNESITLRSSYGSFCLSEIHLTRHLGDFKAEDYSLMFSASIKGYASLHCEEYGHMRTWNIHNEGKTLYIGIDAV